jgi:hypothetical protein
MLRSEAGTQPQIWRAAARIRRSSVAAPLALERSRSPILTLIWSSAGAARTGVLSARVPAVKATAASAEIVRVNMSLFLVEPDRLRWKRFALPPLA